jgi:glutathione S-transferase
MALAQLNISIELREISLKDRPKELLEISSKGTVPVFIINKNEILDESLEIMLWAISNSASNWLEINQQKQMNLISDNDKIFKYWLDRYKYHDRYKDNSFENYQKECAKYLFKYNDMTKNKPFIMGNICQFVDISIFPFIRQCANVDIDWFELNFIYLSKWLNRIISSELFTSIMNKYDIWNPLNENKIVKYSAINISN